MRKFSPLLGLAMLMLLSVGSAAGTGALAGERPAETSGPQAFFLPVYHIPLRVHLNQSNRSPAEFQPMLQEINEIWLSQAGICFEMEIVMNGVPASRGIDLWFEPVLVSLTGGVMNGYYEDDHQIRVRDTPLLGPAGHPARDPAARTAAHELGHSLGLSHRQDSDDNLMRSQTYGWSLSAQEISRARQTARTKALHDRTEDRCGISGVAQQQQSTGLRENGSNKAEGNK